MTRLEEKLYLQSVFDAIDEVYHLKTDQKFSNYQERLRNSLNKLIIPHWFNHDYTSANGLRKTQSHGQVPRLKRHDQSHQTSNGSISSSTTDSQSLSTDTTHRYRSASQSWSEKVPLRRNSTTSSYDRNANIIMNNRRSATSNGTSTYAPGMQRVAQSSTWYKPKLFPIQTHSVEPPRPLPNESKCSSCIESFPSKVHPTPPISHGNLRPPIKPRTLSQIPVPPHHIEHLLDADIDTIEKTFSSRTIEISSLKTTPLPFVPKLHPMTSNPTFENDLIIDRNLLNTDSSSYTSVNDQCLSSASSSLSYHTARAGDTSSSSMTGYETPTPQLDDETLSSHSSLSDLSHAETLEPNAEVDLDTTVVSREEQKTAIIPALDVGMENFPLPPVSTTSSLNDNSPSTESRPIDSANWYDDGSIETCIDQTVPPVSANEQPLIEINDDELSSSFSDDKPELVENPFSATNRLYSMENDNLADEITLTDEFHCSSTVDPFGFNHNHTNSSLMITNLDDILIDDDMDDDPPDKTSSKYLLNTNYRRPIQEDILYEVEHENSYSDHSPNTSSVALADENTSNKIDPNLDLLASLEEPVKEDIHQSTTTTPPVDPKSPKTLSPTDDPSRLPMYTLPPLHTFTEKSSTLQIDTNTNYSMPTWNTSFHQTSNFSSPSSYTSKIRQRHFSVGSYYDNKTTTVAIHPNHTLYIIGSAPVSPINRASTTSSETHYLHHHSPVAYGNTSLNALRRVSPYLETNTFVPSYEFPRSTSFNQDERYYIIPSPSSFPSPPSSGLSQPLNEAPEKTITPPLPPLEREAPLARPKTSRGRERTPPPSPPPRLASEEVLDSPANVYQEIDAQSIDDEQLSTSRNDDLQFIRGTIERVFDFHGESASESSTNYEAISEEIKDENESLLLSESSKTVSKKETTAYPAVEAVQRFYETKSPSESEEKKNKPTTNLDDVPPSNNKSSTSSPLYSRSHLAKQRKQELSKSSSDNEQATSEEIDDTLNDIEDEDYQDEKLRRQATATSNENSPVHSLDNQNEEKKTSQETQTTGRPKPIIVTTQSPSGSQQTIQSYQTAQSSIPPLDIVTQMIIERTDGRDDGRITEISGDMIIFYDDIEIVEHSSEISSTESDTSSSVSKSLKTSKSIPISRESQPPPPPPPIPARTLKPVHLMNNQEQQQLAQPSPKTSAKLNRTYELEKATIRKKFDVNSVNDMLNRTDYVVAPTVTHRHPSARHFAGKLNSEDSSRTSSIVTAPTTIVKPQTLQPSLTNGHSTKHSSATLPIRSSFTAGFVNGKHRSTIADTDALVKQIQSSLSRNSLHDSHRQQTLSVSTKDLRTFVSSTYSPSDQNLMDDDGIVHVREEQSNDFDEQAFKRQARLSKSFHNVSEYSSVEQYPTKKDNNNNNFPSRAVPSKSVENNLHRVSQHPIRHSQIPSNFPPIIASTSFSALPQEDNARLLSMKWYTGQVSENSEICYNTPHMENDDLLYAYISTHSNRETQLLLSRLQASNDIRIHAALDDIRLRVAQFDALKSPEDLHIFMRYLDSRLRDISHKNASLASAGTSRTLNSQRRVSNGYQKQQPDTMSIKSRTSSVGTGLEKETPPLRQMGRQQQHLRSSGNLTGGGGKATNGHHSGPPPPPRRASQSSVNQENPQVFDEMLNTVLGLPKKGASTLPPNSLSSRDKTTPFAQTPKTSNSPVINKNGGDVGKRLFESGTFKDPRLIYDGPKKNEKEEQPLETSV